MRRIKILSFNLGLLTVQFKNKKIFEFTPHLKERFSKIIEELKQVDFDILSLQEIYSHYDVSRICEELKHKYPYQYSPPKSYYLKYSSGLLLLSKLPIKNPEFIQFNQSTWDESIYVHKGFINSYIDFDDYLVQLVNAHTTAGGYFRSPENKKINQIRDHQIDQILKLRDPQSHISLITGDLNCGPQASKENFNKFKLYHFVDVFQYKDDGLYTWDIENPLNKKSFHSFAPSQRIDHILYRINDKKEWDHSDSSIIYKKPIVDIKDENCTLSDHYGVQATLLA